MASGALGRQKGRAERRWGGHVKPARPRPRPRPPSRRGCIVKTSSAPDASSPHPRCAAPPGPLHRAAVLGLRGTVGTAALHLAVHPVQMYSSSWNILPPASQIRLDDSLTLSILPHSRFSASASFAWRCCFTWRRRHFYQVQGPGVERF